MIQDLKSWNFDFGPIADKRCQINLLSRKFVIMMSKEIAQIGNQNIQEIKDTRLKKEFIIFEMASTVSTILLIH